MASMNKYKKDDFKVDFIGIGAPKSATTWIYRCLLEHPEICGPYQKELNYFCTKNFPFKKVLGKNDAYYSSNDGIEHYKKYFSHCKKNLIKGEFSVYYIDDSGAAKLIKRHFPNIKIIVCFRNPVERAYSLYWYAKEYLLTEKSSSFKEAIMDNYGAYIDSGMYYKHLKVYYDLFPRENIKVLFIDDLKKNPIKFMRGIYSFLKVDKYFIASSVTRKENLAKKTRYKLVRKILENIAIISIFLKKQKLYFIVDFLRKLKLENLIFYILYKLNTSSFKKPKIDLKTEKKLRDIFRQDIEKLEELLNKDLSAWK